MRFTWMLGAHLPNTPKEGALGLRLEIRVYWGFIYIYMGFRV